jgi:hypothetical protein
MAVSEASKEKLRVCLQIEDNFYRDFLFRCKISLRLYVPNFARAN